MATDDCTNNPPHYEDMVTRESRDAAVAGAYLAVRDAIKNAPCKEFECGCWYDRIPLLTPTSAQKAFADAVAAEVESNVHVYRAQADAMQQQLTRLTEEKERLRAGRQELLESLQWALETLSVRISVDPFCRFCMAQDETGDKHGPDCVWVKACKVMLAQAALTPAAGGETRGK